jgi:hypothetical protein
MGIKWWEREKCMRGSVKGSEGQTQLQYFNLAMENVLKGLPVTWQISFFFYLTNQLSRHHTQMHFKSFMYTCFNHFQIARHRHMFHSKHICPLLFRKRKRRGHIFFEWNKSVPVLQDRGDYIGFLYTKKRCRDVLQCLTPAYKVFRDRMTKKCM